jgi:hypothetical protein
VQNIQALLLSLNENGVNIRFAWVPGHSGIPGNEIADRAAKDAVDNGELFTNLVPINDVKAEFRDVVMEEWNQSWWSITSNKLRVIKEVPTAWPSSVRSSRREEVVLTRLRIGHCALTHSYLFTEERIPPRCDVCDCPLTVNHLLTECAKYMDCRGQFQLTGGIARILGDDPDSVTRVIKFLTISGLLNNI